MKTAILAIILLVAGPVSAQPTVLYTQADREIFQEYLTTIEAYREASMPAILENTALFFLGKSYVAHTLEGSSEELLTVNLREFDCTTFVETVLALSLTTASEVPSFETFLVHLQSMRYRNGAVDGYASRLHYATDWIYENTQRRLMCNLSASLGGVKEEKPLNFITEHREAYSRLKEDDAMLDSIAIMEEMVNRRGGFYYLPKERIKKAANHIPHMAIILFTTAIEGLDVTHMGFAFRKGEQLTFLHASSTGEVKVDERSIEEYTRNQRNTTGIIVAEINPAYSK